MTMGVRTAVTGPDSGTDFNVSAHHSTMSSINKIPNEVT